MRGRLSIEVRFCKIILRSRLLRNEMSAPCLGYVFRELGDIHARKLVVLGDTCDPTGITPLAQNASLLIHEATDAYIPADIDPALGGRGKTPESILEKTVAKGHSTPGMAGAFARTINAERLVLNHFSGKSVVFLILFLSET